MPYIEGFVAAVPTANREAYIETAKQGAEFFKKLGASRVTECWGDDVPRGEVTDFFRATQAKDDETVIFSWIEYPDKATRDAANEKMRADAEMMDMEMPFDGQRMFWGRLRAGAERLAPNELLGGLGMQRARLWLALALVVTALGIAACGTTKGTRAEALPPEAGPNPPPERPANQSGSRRTWSSSTNRRATR